MSPPYSYTTERLYAIYKIADKKLLAIVPKLRLARNIISLYPVTDIAVMCTVTRYKVRELPNGNTAKEVLSEWWEILQLQKEEYG